VTRFPAWRVIAWMCAAHVASMSGFSVYATLLPRLQDEWGMNNSEAGFVSGMFFAGYMAAVPLLTSLTDRVDARRVYLVSSFVAAVALAGFALFVEGVKSAALLQLAAGAGIAGTYMPGLRALTDNVEGARGQSRAVAFYTAFFGLGSSLSILVSGSIADAVGWRWAFAQSFQLSKRCQQSQVAGWPHIGATERHEKVNICRPRPDAGDLHEGGLSIRITHAA